MTWTLAGLIISVGMTAYLLGRRKVLLICGTAAGVALFTWLCVLAYRATHHQPERPLELTLQLARRQWGIDEEPWYLLQIKNVGYQKVTVPDNFWVKQVQLEQNSQSKEYTYFEVVDPDGRLMKFSAEWGQHGEFFFWVNDCGGKICEYDNNGHHFYFELKRGQVLTATPSVVAPLRKQDGLGLNDARIRPGSTKAEQEAYKKLWRIHQDEMEIMSGARHRSGAYEPPEKPLYPGYRVLEGYAFKKIGRYRMKAIYEPTSREFVEGRMRKGELPLYGGLPEGTKIFRYESNEVEFEVVP